MREATSAIRGRCSGRPGGANNLQDPSPLRGNRRAPGSRDPIYQSSRQQVMRPQKPLPKPADQGRRSGIPSHSSHASASLRQREGFSLSTVSIDHILHGLRRACIVGQKEKWDRVNDTQVCSLHPRSLPRSQNILGLLHRARHDNWCNRR